MNNPWQYLPNDSPYVLLDDSRWIDSYQKNLQRLADKKSDERKRQMFLHDYSLHTDIIPFPYYGDPKRVKVIALQANPGYDPLWQENSITSHILDFDRKNLLHNNLIPLCYTQPKFACWQYNDGKPNEDWYWKRTRELREKIGWKAIAIGLMYMEAFPYRSIKLFAPKMPPPSQQYTFYLLREALKQNAWVVMTRMDNYWFENVPELREHRRLVKLKNRRSVYLSPGNMDIDAFELISEVLKEK